jgi:hypothetical protein
MARSSHILGFRPASDTVIVQDRFDAYWHALRDPAEDVPRWDRFDPMDVPFALGSLSIIEVVEGPDFLIRLLATNIQGRLKKFTPGMSIHDFPEDDQKKTMVPAFEACRRQRAPSAFESEVLEFEQSCLYRGRLWPFADESGRIIRVAAVRARLASRGGNKASRLGQTG